AARDAADEGHFHRLGARCVLWQVANELQLAVVSALDVPALGQPMEDVRGRVGVLIAKDSLDFADRRAMASVNDLVPYVSQRLEFLGREGLQILAHWTALYA